MFFAFLLFTVFLRSQGFRGNLDPVESPKNGGKGQEVFKPRPLKVAQ